MLMIETLPVLRREVRRWRQDGKRIALVPTMGNLHEGHLTLVDEARERADIVIVSILLIRCSSNAQTIWPGIRAPCRKTAKS